CLYLSPFCYCFLLIFFFQAEDGIRDFHVTGVQTCALPIYFFFIVLVPGILPRSFLEHAFDVGGGLLHLLLLRFAGDSLFLLRREGTPSTENQTKDQHP